MDGVGADPEVWEKRLGDVINCKQAKSSPGRIFTVRHIPDSWKRPVAMKSCGTPFTKIA
jgi:hypothetical protein